MHELEARRAEGSCNAAVAAARVFVCQCVCGEGGGGGGVVCLRQCQWGRAVKARACLSVVAMNSPVTDFLHRTNN